MGDDAGNGALGSTALGRRKLWQWALAYGAAAWVALQVLGFLASAYGWPMSALRVGTGLAITGFPIALVLAWYHGERGRQRVTAAEIAIIAIVLALGCGTIWLGERNNTAPPTRRTVSKSLAVLPFENRSGDASQDYFATGLTDELTTELARIADLRVIARSSAARYRGSDKSPAVVAGELGVGALLTGTVLRAGGRVRYTAELVSASDESSLWAERFERDERDVLALQSEVARAIAQAIAARLSPDESARLARTRPVDPAALDAYLRGRVLWNQRSEAAVREALVHFKNAVGIAPDFALGHAGLADAHIILGVYGYDAPKTAFPAAKAAAQHAIELDGGVGEPHASLGDILFHYDWDWAGSTREHRIAMKLSPGFATAYFWAAEARALEGDVEEALALTRKARELDPLSMTIRAQLALALAADGRIEDSLRELRDALALDPKHARTRREIARLLLAAGRRDEALAEARQLAVDDPDSVFSIATLGLCLGAAGHADEARATLARLEQMSQARFVPAHERARVTAGLRDRDATLRYLERAVEAREGFLPWLGQEPEFGFLHDDARFVALVQRIGIRMPGAP